jgi:methionyl-tRNA synthetase
MARKWFDDSVPPYTVESDTNHPLALKAQATIETVMRCMPELGFKAASESILQLAIAANGHLNDTAPWSRMKQPGEEQAVANDLYVVLESTRIVGLLLAPLLPELSSRILDQLDCSLDPEHWLDQLHWGGLISGTELPKPVPVMARLELDEDL